MSREGEEGRRSIRLSLVLKPQLYERLRRAAEREGVDMSEFIRQAIREKLEKMGL